MLKCTIYILQDNGYFEMFAEDGFLPFGAMTYQTFADNSMTADII